jgi:hypothetical protein
VARIFAGGFGREFRYLQPLRIGAVVFATLIIPYLYTYRYLAGSLDDVSVHSPQRLVLVSLMMIGSIAFFRAALGLCRRNRCGENGERRRSRWPRCWCLANWRWSVGSCPRPFRSIGSERIRGSRRLRIATQALPRGAAEKSLIALLSPATELEARQARQQLQTPRHPHRGDRRDDVRGLRRSASRHAASPRPLALDPAPDPGSKRSTHAS